MKEIFQLVKAYRANRKEAIREKKVHKLACSYSQEAIDAMTAGLCSPTYVAYGLPPYADTPDDRSSLSFLENWLTSYHFDNPELYSAQAVKYVEWSMARHTNGENCPVFLSRLYPGSPSLELGLLTNEYWWALVKNLRVAHEDISNTLERLPSTGRLAVWRVTVKAQQAARVAAEIKAIKKARLLRTAEAIEDTLNKDIYGLAEHQRKFMCSALFRQFGFAEDTVHSFARAEIMHSINQQPTLWLHLHSQGLIHPNREMGMHDMIILGKQHYRKLIRQLREQAAAL